MKAQWAAAVLACAVLVAGCASSVTGDATVQSTSTPQPGPSSPGPVGTVSFGTASPPSGSASGPSSDSASGASQIPPGAPSGSGSQVTPGVGGASAPPPVSTASTPPSTPASTTASPPPEQGGTGGTGGGAVPDAFKGATDADPAKFPGSVTPIGFGSPSGNINCGFWDGGAITCQIADFTYTPKPSHDCHGAGNWGTTVHLQGAAPEFICAGDVEGGGPPLAYGRQLTVGSLRCVSREAGVTCQDTGTGYGFLISRATVTFFGPGGTLGSSGTSGTSGAIPAALAGDWGGHGRNLVITSTGNGTLDYRTYQWCSDNPTPPCDGDQNGQIVPGGHITFELTAASGKSGATGKVTASNDPQTPVGKAVTATVSGYNLNLSIWPGTPFCAPNTPSDKWNCGA